MKNAADWKPTKYLIRRGRLRATSDRRHLGAGSWLIADRVAAYYDDALRNFAKGRLLDLGCGTVPLFEAYGVYAEDVCCVDWAGSLHENKHVDIYCDLSERLPLEAADFDCVILSDVLEHIYRPLGLLKEIHRVLKPGGTLLLNVPFLYRVHEAPHDYFRYTEFALGQMAEEADLEVIRLTAIGGAPEVLADLVGKLLAYGGPVGKACASAVQRLTNGFVRLRVGSRVSAKSAKQFPLGYFMVCRKVERPSGLERVG